MPYREEIRRQKEYLAAKREIAADCGEKAGRIMSRLTPAERDATKRLLTPTKGLFGRKRHSSDQNARKFGIVIYEAWAAARAAQQANAKAQSAQRELDRIESLARG